MRNLALMLLVLAIVLMAGCAHNEHRATAEAAYYEAQAQRLADRQPIVELVAREGEEITMQGVERFAVYAPGGEQTAIEQYRSEANPWVRGIEVLADVALKGFGIDRLYRFGSDALQHAGGNVTVGGDQIGGDRVDDRSVGGDRIGGDRVDDRSVGRDQIGGDRVDNRHGRIDSPGDNRWESPGPIDEDNSVINPPDDPPEDPPDDD